jgi:hypothetical protein
VSAYAPGGGKRARIPCAPWVVLIGADNSHGASRIIAAEGRIAYDGMAPPGKTRPVQRP